MKIFHCHHCQHLVFFESHQCLGCGRALGYLPDLRAMGSLEPAGGNEWVSPISAARGRRYRLCSNYERENICNWAVAAEDPNPLCLSCRLTRTIPDLTRPGHKEAWYRLETAKRRLIYSLLDLGLPLQPKEGDAGDAPEADPGVAFEFLADPETPGAAPVLTGHADGIITINLAEADDAERERRRRDLHEPYRTLLGHFRHEIGHHYWDRLIAGSDRLDAFRDLFGDERQDYGEALKRHYAQGPAPDWQQRFVSAYAGSHPWEDWAETWAHYLHMADSLETAAACGLSLNPRRRDEPTMTAGPYAAAAAPRAAFDRMIEDWYPLTYALNNLNRGLGLPDGYPFVLSAPAVEKLRFVSGTIEAWRREGAGSGDRIRVPGADTGRPAEPFPART